MGSLSILESVEQTLAPSKVSIVEFAESSDYCNKLLFPRQRALLKLFFLEELDGEEEDVLTYWTRGGRGGHEIVISPDMRERTEWLRANKYSHFREIILPGGRRSSKGFITGIAMAKVMWDCLQLQDPGDHYGIDSSKEIFFSCVAGSEEQAKNFQYADFSSSIEDCKSFDPYLVKSLETEIRVATNMDLRKAAQARAQGNKVQKDIAGLRGKALAANAGTLRGSATMAICIDEMAHMIPGESKAAADKVYEAADPSLDQFGLDGIMFCNSSPYTKVGMFYERYVAALRHFDPTRPAEEAKSIGGEDEDDSTKNGDPRIMTFQYPSWALYEGYQKSPKRHRFKGVIMASPDWDVDEKDDEGEEIWNDQDKARIIQARAKEAAGPEAYKVERRGLFAEVTEAFLLPTMVDRMYAGKPSEWVYDLNQTIPRLQLKSYRSNAKGEEALNIFRYKIHVDPSSTVAGFGLAIAHLETFERWDGVPENHVVFDLIKRWMPPKGGAISWEPILKELEVYADIFRPFEITMDQHQSAEPIQDLKERLNLAGIATQVYEKVATNELNWKRWEVFRTALYNGQVHAPLDVPLEEEWSVLELKFLQENKTGGKFPRVDKQDIGPVQTKDMADCIAECTYALVGNMMVNRTRENLAHGSLAGGAPGGYGIGFSGLPQSGGLTSHDGQNFYSEQARKERQSYQNPARGIVSRGRGRSGNGNRARW